MADHSYLLSYFLDYAYSKAPFEKKSYNCAKQIFITEMNPYLNFENQLNIYLNNLKI